MSASATPLTSLHPPSSPSHTRHASPPEPSAAGLLGAFLGIGRRRGWRTALAIAEHDRVLRRALSQLHGRLLDIGCADKPYADMARPFITEHIGVDHDGTQHDNARPDITANAYRIPLPDASCDSILCTAVLEHLEEPALALAEAHRLLGPGGTAIYTAPFIWHEHEAPRDFYRYSRFGLEHLFKTTGFSDIRVTPMGGFWITAATMLSYKLYRYKARGRLSPVLRAIPIIDAIAILLQLAALAIHRLDPAPQWAWMHLVIARKPVLSPPGNGPDR